MKRRTFARFAAPVASLCVALAAITAAAPGGAEPAAAPPAPAPPTTTQPTTATPAAATPSAVKSEQPATAAEPDGAAKQAPKVALELNKLEATPKGCRVYMVTTNGSEAAYPVYQLDIVLFQPDGVIAKRVAMDFGPLRPSKRSLKLFDLDGLPCERIGSMLVNEAIECKGESGPVSQGACLGGLTLSALGQVKITK